MFNLGEFIDLPFVWGVIIALAVFLYVLLDGFDLGVGILFPFAPSDKCRDRMMNSIAPFWDGNETWLVLGGGGLFAAFPLAYSILMPAFYIPVILMLLSLILRGVVFEFRFKAIGRSRKLWDYIFHFASIGAAFSQGVILGAFVQGVKVTKRSFSGDPFDWLNSFSIMTGLALVSGYALLGATWLVMKTEDTTAAWARRTASYILGIVGFFMVLVSLSVPFMDEDIRTLWFSIPNIFILAFVPLITLLLFVLLWRDLYRGKENSPFFLTIGLFIMGYSGLAISLIPWIVPFQLTLWQAAASPESQSLLLIGTVILLPIILTYTGYSYYVFRGKASDETHHY